MAGCSSCGGKKSGVAYEVTFHDNSKQTYTSVAEARAAGSATKQPYTFKAVAAG